MAIIDRTEPGLTRRPDRAQRTAAAAGHRPPALALMAGAAAAALLSGCLATAPSIGGGSAGPATGSAGGATTTGANSTLEKCTETLGTVSIDEQTNAPWYAQYMSRYQTGSTVPALRLLIQQSNCFVIVDRGRGLAARTREMELMRGEEGRAGSNVGGGQVVGADYTVIPEVMLSDRGGTRGVGGLGGLLPGPLGLAAGVVGGSMSSNEAGTMLTLIDNRSTVQLAAAEGYSKNMDFGAVGALFGGAGAAGGGMFTSTPQGKVLMAAFTDSYNKMVVSLRNYKAQTVKGGLGTGGTLGVQGGSTEAAKSLQPASAVKPVSTATPASTPSKKK
jgi:curli biogenesis system outer membrane secretion channel CsgG